MATCREDGRRGVECAQDNGWLVEQRRDSLTC